MDGRHTIVGADHDYEQLMHVGAEPGLARPYPPQHASQGGYPQGYPPPGYYPPPPGYYPPQAPAALPPPPPPLQPPRHIVAEPLTRSRDFPVGFTRFQIQPGDPVEIEVKPQVLFKGKRLAVAPSIAKDFMIVDIKVGKNSQLAATGEMSAEAFSALAVGTQMELDTASPGITITMRVRNISQQTLDFKAVLYGAVME